MIWGRFLVQQFQGNINSQGADQGHGSLNDWTRMSLIDLSLQRAAERGGACCSAAASYHNIESLLHTNCIKVQG
jgi:hypothetical protein